MSLEVDDAVREKRAGEGRGLAAITLAVGLVLFTIYPGPLLPFLISPIDGGLHALGLLGARPSNFDGGFAAVMVLRWVAVALMLLFIVAVERQPLSSVGIRMPKPRDVAFGLAAGLLALLVFVPIYLLWHGPGFDASTQTGEVVRSLGLAGRAQVAINAAVVEELFFRGVLIERLVRIVGRPWGLWLAAAVSFVLFVGLHYASGSASLAQTVAGDVPGGLALVALYLLRRNLPACVIAHSVMNLVLLFPAL